MQWYKTVFMKPKSDQRPCTKTSKCVVRKYDPDYNKFEFIIYCHVIVGKCGPEKFVDGSEIGFKSKGREPWYRVYFLITIKKAAPPGSSRILPGSDATVSLWGHKSPLWRSRHRSRLATGWILWGRGEVTYGELHAHLGCLSSYGRLNVAVVWGQQ